MKKPILTLDKIYEAYITNDGYIVSEFCCNPLKVKQELNLI